MVAPSEGITTVSSTFKLPKVTCPVANTADLYFGLDLTPPAGDEVQGGADDAFAQVDILCDNGTPEYLAQAASGSASSELFELAAGDTVQTRIAETSPGNTIATFDDFTTGALVNEEGSTNTSDNQVILGAESVYGEEDINAIAKFAKMTFTNVQVGGLDWNLTSPAPTAYALNQDGNSNTTQLVPSATPAKPSTTFTLTEKTYQ